MRASEIIRTLLDAIDQIDQPNQSQLPKEETETIRTGQDTNRFKQIVDMLTAERTGAYDNSPNQVVAGIEAVTTHAGGGWNGPKNPADMKANTMPLYPGYQAEK